MKNLDIIEKKISNFLEENYKALKSERNFYGLSFTALCFSDNKEIIEFCIKNIELLDCTKKDYHFEFNNYAIISLYAHKKIPSNSSLLKKIKYSKNETTNWTLLRYVCQYKLTPSKKLLEKVISFVQSRQTGSGFIMDTLEDKSVQYHCFCSALIGELYQITKNQDLLKIFLKANGFIKNLIFPDGTTLVVGRGQEQIFGYGCLVYSLAFESTLQEKSKNLILIDRIVNHLINFLKKDGSIPLVLNKNNKEKLGWYNYNNYYDYLPFFLYYIIQSKKIIKSEGNHVHYFVEEEFQDSDFEKKVTKSYISLISAPLGFCYNSLCIPLIFSIKENTFKTIFYGGDQFGTNLYSKFSIPLPYGKIGFQIFFRGISLKEKIKFLIRRKEEDTFYFFHDHLNFKIQKNCIVGENNLFTFIRKFTYGEDTIVISDSIRAKTKVFFPSFRFFSFFGKSITKIGDGVFNVDGLELAIEGKYTIINENKLFYNALGELFGIKVDIKKFTFNQEKGYFIQYSIKIK